MFCNLSGPQTILQVKKATVEVKQVLVMPMLIMEPKRGNPESLIEQVISKNSRLLPSVSANINFSDLYCSFSNGFCPMDRTECFGCHLIITYFILLLIFFLLIS